MIDLDPSDPINRIATDSADKVAVAALLATTYGVAFAHGAAVADGDLLVEVAMWERLSSDIAVLLGLDEIDGDGDAQGLVLQAVADGLRHALETGRRLQSMTRMLALEPMGMNAACRDAAHPTYPRQLSPKSMCPCGARIGEDPSPTEIAQALDVMGVPR